MRVAIVGPGRMGGAVAAICRERGHEIARDIDVGELSRDAVAEADVAIEFTTPEAAADNLIALASFGLPVVCGTTGWYDRLDEVRAAVTDAGTALVYAPNFSLGVQVLLRLAAELGGLLRGRPEFDAYLIERHHRHKQDAPSGTARALQDVLCQADATRAYPVTSIRAGEIPGTHEIHLDTHGESLRIVHEARDRSIFARGAVTAAEWLVTTGRTGVFRFADILAEETRS